MGRERPGMREQLVGILLYGYHPYPSPRKPVSILSRCEPDRRPPLAVEVQRVDRLSAALLSHDFFLGPPHT
jgi:hypothetical protein